MLIGNEVFRSQNDGSLRSGLLGGRAGQSVPLIIMFHLPKTQSPHCSIRVLQLHVLVKYGTGWPPTQRLPSLAAVGSSRTSNSPTDPARLTAVFRSAPHDVSRTYQPRSEGVWQPALSSTSKELPDSVLRRYSCSNPSLEYCELLLLSYSPCSQPGPAEVWLQV